MGFELDSEEDVLNADELFKSSIKIVTKNYRKNKLVSDKKSNRIVG